MSSVQEFRPHRQFERVQDAIYQTPKVHPSVQTHRPPFCILNLDTGLEEAQVPGWQTFRKIVREEIDVDLHCTSAKFTRKRGEHHTFANGLATEGSMVETLLSCSMIDPVKAC
jgi:hypothetical protein